VLAGLLLGIAFGAGAAIALHGGANKNCTNNNPCNGTNGPDDIFGTNDYNNINALEGADMGWAYDHGDHFDGAGGADYAAGGAGDDGLDGQNWIDSYIINGECCFGLEGQNNNDLNHGGDEGDIVGGGDWADTLYGGPGGDDVLGGYGDDYLDGGDGGDGLNGGPGNDTCIGGGGNDTKVNCES